MGKNEYVNARVSLTLDPALVEEYRQIAQAEGMPLSKLLAIVLEAARVPLGVVLEHPQIFNTQLLQMSASFSDEVKYQLRLAREKGRK